MSNESLKKRMLRAGSWSLIGYAANQIIRLGSNLLLTRMLAPDMFGVMAVGYLVVAGFTMASDLGLIGGTIQSPRGDEPLFLNTTWVVNIGRGVLIASCMLLTAGLMTTAPVHALLPAHSVYVDPRVPTLLASLSLVSIISGFESTKVFVAQRHLNLSPMVKIDLICQVASTAFILLWAWFSPSVWALVFGWVLSALIRMVLTHVMLPGPSNRFEWEQKAFWEVFHFGKWALLSSALSWLLSNGDRLLLGSLIDASAMGLYSIAFLLVNALQGAIFRLAGATVLPALSEIHRERPHELKNAIYKLRRPLDLVCVVATGGLFTMGPAIVHLLYDPRYAAAGPILSLLGLTLIATRLNIIDQALIATARMNLLSMLNAARIVALYAIVPLGYWWGGTQGAIAGVGISALVSALVSLGLLAKIGMIDVRHELLALPLFAVGAGLGWVGSKILGV